MNKIIYLTGYALLGILAGWLCDEKDALIIFLVMIVTIIAVALWNLATIHLFSKQEKKTEQESKEKPNLCQICDNYSFPFENCQMCDGEDFFRSKEVQR